jgi:AbrB family looped-hinge helix DNA binding protein
MKVTERGQITIPKKLREKYGISDRTEVEVQDTGGGLLIVKKVGTSPFRKFLGKANAKGLPRSTDAFLLSIREGR